MSIKRSLKSFRKNADIHRHNSPKIPSAATLKSLPPDEAKELFDNFEKSFYQYLDKEKESFENALPRISACAFLKGFLNPFNPRINLDNHYSWCPFEEWYSPDKNVLKFNED